MQELIDAEALTTTVFVFLIMQFGQCLFVFLLLSAINPTTNSQNLRPNYVSRDDDLDIDLKEKLDTQYQNTTQLKYNDQITNELLDEQLKQELEELHDLFDPRKFESDGFLLETFEGFNRTLKSESEYVEKTTLDNPTLSKIIGGRIVSDQDRYPYMASILNSRRLSNGGIRVWHVCGGSLIAPNVVLGAAHCAGPVADYIQLGKKHVEERANILSGDQVETFRIQKQVFHPLWNRRLFYKDMVLYKLDGKTNKKPVKLTTSNRDDVMDDPGKLNTILGWGKTDINGDPSPYLRHTEVDYIPHRECVSHKYSYGSIIKEDAMMCFADTGKDACQGDSGGPLVQVDKRRRNDPVYDVQIGVISWGVDCAHRRYPGVYAKIDFDWIEHAVCNSINGLSPESCKNGKLYPDDSSSNQKTGISSTNDSHKKNSCKDLEADQWFHEDWDKYAWNCPKVKRWWWYACIYYSSQCPESCCGENNCDPDTGMCLKGEN